MFKTTMPRPSLKVEQRTTCEAFLNSLGLKFHRQFTQSPVFRWAIPALSNDGWFCESQKSLTKGLWIRELSGGLHPLQQSGWFCLPHSGNTVMLRIIYIHSKVKMIRGLRRHGNRRNPPLSSKCHVFFYVSM